MLLSHLGISHRWRQGETVHRGTVGSTSTVRLILELGKSSEHVSADCRVPTSSERMVLSNVSLIVSGDSHTGVSLCGCRFPYS